MVAIVMHCNLKSTPAHPTSRQLSLAVFRPNPTAPEHILITQRRRQDLLQGGAKMEIMSWGTHDGLQGRVQQLLDD